MSYITTQPALKYCICPVSFISKIDRVIIETVQYRVKINEIVFCVNENASKLTKFRFAEQIMQGTSCISISTLDCTFVYPSVIVHMELPQQCQGC